MQHEQTNLTNLIWYHDATDNQVPVGTEPSVKVFTILFDGGCVPNPGRGYGSYEIRGLVDNQYCYWQRKNRIDFGYMTNNAAEYQALICALSDLIESLCTGFLYENGVCRGNIVLKIQSDSQLVVRQLLNQYRTKHPQLKQLIAIVRSHLSHFGRWTISWTPRQTNLIRFGH